jgi:hypothetical protein
MTSMLSLKMAQSNIYSDANSPTKRLTDLHSKINKKSGDNSPIVTPSHLHPIPT